MSWVPHDDVRIIMHSGNLSRRPILKDRGSRWLHRFPGGRKPIWIGGPVGTAVRGRIIHSKFENPKSMVISKYRSGPWQLLPRDIRGSREGPDFLYTQQGASAP